MVVEEFTSRVAIPASALYVRNKHPQGMKTSPADKILLFVHGATYPAETTFDLRLNGLSWMDYIARHGYDVYLVDLRGYGKSTRPPEMEQPPEQNEPIVRTETAVQRRGRRGGLHPRAPRRRQDQPHGLVLGHDHHGLVHRAEQRQGGEARALRPAVAAHRGARSRIRAAGSAPTAGVHGLREGRAG